MERLLADAEKLSGVKYDIDNLGDVYSAIHVIQEDLGLTGVAAEEASSTFTGSFGAMKAAATNLLADLSTGGDVQASLDTLLSTAETFLVDNLIPMLVNIVSGIATAVREADWSELIANGKEVFAEIMTAILGEDNPILNWVTENAEILKPILVGIAGALVAYKVATIAASVAQGVLNAVMAANPVGILALAIAGLIAAIIYLWNTNEEFRQFFIDAWEGLKETIGGIVEGISTFFTVSIPEAFNSLVTTASNVVSDIENAFLNFDWKQLGTNILEGIKDGIVGAVSAVVEAAKNAAKAIFDAVKGFFEIGSPSKLMNREIGKWIPAGIAVGIESNMDEVSKAVDEMNASALNSASNIDYSVKAGQLSNNSNEQAINDLAGALGNNQTNVTVVLEGDARRLFKIMQSEATNYNTLTGRNAFA